MKVQCEFLAAMRRGEYIPASQCSCPECEFLSDVWTLEEKIVKDGELPDGWEELSENYYREAKKRAQKFG